MMGLPARMVSWSRHQLQSGRQRTSFILACGAGEAQDVCAIVLFKPPWPIFHSLSVLSSSHGDSGQIRLSSSSVWSKSSTNSDASGEAQLIEELWENYFVDPWQWWDNRIGKWTPRSPDFKHKVTRKALWLDSWSTPAWVKRRLKSVTQGNSQSLTDYQHNRISLGMSMLPKGNIGKEILCLPVQVS